MGMLKTRRSWYVLMIVIGIVFAEGFSWSTPVILSINGLFVFLIYGVHYTLIVDYLARHRALTLRALAIGGFVVGITTESLITKVIWNPPWDDGEVIRILGLGLYETGFIVLVWHAWMSMALPFALGLSVFGYAEVLTPRQIQRVLYWLPLTFLYSASIQSLELIPLALLGIPLNLLLIMWAARWHQQHRQQDPLPNLDAVILGRRARWATWALLLACYALLIPERAEAFPDAGPFLLGMTIMVWSFWFLRRVAHVDAGKTPPPPPQLPDAVTYSARDLRRYGVYLGLTALLLSAIGVVTQPVSSIIVILASLVALVVGDLWFVRLTLRLRRANPQRH